MRNPQNRDALTRLYRWLEPREYPAKMDTDTAVEFFKAAWAELAEIMAAYPESNWIKRLATGYYEALEEAWKAAQKGEETNGTTKGC